VSRARKRSSPGSRARRPWWLAGAVLAAAATAAGLGVVGLRTAREPSAAAGDSGPNVLLITCDTTRADHLGCYGRERASTPHIDRLAAEGVRFTRCSTCVPLTTAAHASIMTGTYPFVHGVRDNGNHRLADGITTLAEALQGRGFTTHGIVAAFILNRMFGLDQGFARYQDLQLAPGSNVRHAERRGDAVADDAIRALQDLAAKRFFLWVHFYDPHNPTDYDQEIAFMDAQIGRLLQTLEQLHVEKNTLVVLVGDHGEGLGEHDEDFHGDFVYESTLHVPLVFRWLGTLPERKVVEARVRTIDIPVTILDLVGAPPLAGVQGVTLTPLLQGATADLGLAAYGEALRGRLQFGFSALRSLTSREWKYVLAPEPELYHLPSDPGEKTNLIAENAAVASSMRTGLKELIRSAPVAIPSDAVGLSATDLAQLQSLGYAGAARGPEAGAELARFEPSGDDPKRHTQTIRLYSQVAPALSGKDYGRAQSLLEQIITAAPGAAMAYGDLALTLQLQGRIQDAIDLYRRALELNPELTNVRRMFARLYISQGQWVEAAELLTQILGEVPQDDEMHYLKGMALASLGRLDEGRSCFEQALAINPTNTLARYWLGMVCAQQQRYTEAEAHFMKVLELEPGNERSRRELENVRRLMAGE
jgi:arylsulfatase A-like enzyme/Flp pilus assembly protein TadD